MHFFQSTSTWHKYFTELSVRENELLSTEARHELLFPYLSIRRFTSEILQFAQSRNADNSEEIGYSATLGRIQCKDKNQRGLRFAHAARLRAFNEDAKLVNEEENCEDERLVSEVGGGTKGRRNSWRDMPKFLLAGAVSTVISRTCIAPLERIKLECIVQGSKNTWLKIVRCIWVSEGLKGFWKGNALNLFRMVPFKSVNFICYDMYLDRLLNSSENKEITNHDRLIGGGISGVVATVLCLPLDTIRTRLIAPGGEALGGVAGCFFHMIQNEGFASLYKGLTPALVSMGPASAVFYAVYDILKSSHLSHKRKTSRDSSSNSNDIGVIWTLIYGAIAGACAETVIYPLEVVRRQLQLQKSTSLGLASTIIKLIERDGVGSLYAGLFPSTLQVLPSASLSYLFYEMMKSVLKIS